MDVITILQPENHVMRPHFPVPERNRTGGERTVTVPSFASLQEMPAAASFPVLFLFLVTACIAFTPLLQQRYGFYRLEKLSFAGDGGSETAMRLLAAPESDLSLFAAGEAAAPELPAGIQVVSWSTYKVRNGDTLSAILSRSSLRNISTILSANGIDNARRLRSGQTLKIPSMDGIVHTVVRGDSLAALASRYGVAVTVLLDANDLSRETLAIGQTLFIPGAALSPDALRRAMGELFVYPTRGRLTSRFGYRSDPFTGVRSFHTGIDLASPAGTPVKATLDGKIAVTGYSPVYGNYVIITHEAGYQSLYGHLSTIAVKRGQGVAQGAVIGKVGNTGYSTGSHLHFSVYRNGKMIDPFSVLN